jgi:hypothetical protein
MSDTSRQLDDVQRWMLSAITKHGDAADGVDELILPSQQQSAAERLAIYSHAYFARLLEVLRELLPCTRFAVGDELFDRFAVGYLQAHPPRSYTLARLADRFLDYLDATRPADWGQFVVELVRLELAIDRLFDCPGPEGLPPLEIPSNANEALRLKLVPGFELHTFHYPVSDYYTSWKGGQQPPWPEPNDQFVALLRRDYVVRRYELTALQHDVLQNVSRGWRLDDALTQVAGEMNLSTEELAVLVRRWFASWASERFFATASF